MARKLRTRRKDGAPPRCTRPGHERSDVRFFGFYGPPGHRRQRYKCWPKNGAPHTFTEVLPRQHTHSGDCYECERTYAPHEGPPTPRLYEFSARDIAHALVAVGEGQSYRSAGAKIRERTGRVPVAGYRAQRRRLRHGQLVADWVEVFAPHIFEKRRDEIENSYATLMTGRGTLLLDALPFNIRGRTRKPGGERAFTIYAAMAYTGANDAKLVRLSAFRGTRTNVELEWEEFLRSFPGASARVVCDHERSLVRAVRTVWPETEIFVCEWHRKQRLVKVLEENGAWGSRDKDDETQALGIRRIRAAAHKALTTEDGWDEFCQLARKLRIKQLDAFIRKNDALTRDHIARRPTEWRHERGLPVSTGPLEQKLRVLRDDYIKSRRFAFRNRERFNRLLMLIHLEMDGYSDEREYAAFIREWLMTNAGRPLLNRRAVTDQGGHSSLRASP